jgi:hypothetical protein
MATFLEVEYSGALLVLSGQSCGRRGHAIGCLEYPVVGQADTVLSSRSAGGGCVRSGRKEEWEVGRREGGEGFDQEPHLLLLPPTTNSLHKESFIRPFKVWFW